MKVIKRDGRIVEYDKEKIKIAIEKANNEVSKKEKATEKDINAVIEYIEDLKKKRILVEDIQDIIEQKLMELGKYELAKKYIVYRYNRALIRKSNTTDASILGLIRSGNKGNINSLSKELMTIPMQRNLIVGEVSKDLTERILLPEKIVKAWKNEILYFHGSEYFIQPIINSCFVNMEDMLDNGTVKKKKKIDQPSDFQTACIIMAQIIAIIQNNQYGEQRIDVSCLGKYLRKSRESYENEIKNEFGSDLEKFNIIINKHMKKELSQGIKYMLYQINTLISLKGMIPLIVFILSLKQDDEYIFENSLIIEEILKQKSEGFKNKDGDYVEIETPKLVFIKNEFIEKNYNKLLVIADKCSCIEQDYEINRSFNQGMVTINLESVADASEENEEKYWKILEERLELCREALMYRYYALLGTVADVSPMHWMYGAISRLESGEKIDKLLNSEYSDIYLRYVGLEKISEKVKGKEISEQEAKAFEAKTIEYIKKKTIKWKKETNIKFVLIEK